MKILIVRPYATVPDKNQYNLQHIGLAKAFLRKGHQCDIVYWVGKGKECIEHIVAEEGSFNIYWFQGMVIEKSVIFNTRKIDNLISGYDIVQTEEYEQLFSCYLAWKYPDKVVVYHGPYKSDFTRRYNFKSAIYDLFWARKLIKKNVQFITKTNAAKRTLEAKGFSEIQVSPVGLDISKFSKDEPDYTFMVNDEKKLKLLYVGQLCDRRCIPLLIDIIVCLRKQGINAQLSLIGKGTSDYIAMCKDYAMKWNVEAYVDFLGSKRQEELEKEYREHDIFILCTRFEIFGMVLLEALYFGRIVIASLTGGTETIIKNGENGFLIEGFDKDMWVDQIARIYCREYDLELIMRSARRSVLEHFSWNESADIFIEIYKTHLLKRENKYEARD